MKFGAPVFAASCVFVLLSSASAQDEPEEKPGTRQAEPPARSSPRPEQLIPLRDLPKDLRGSVASLFSRENLAPFLIGVGATGTAAAFDQDFREFFDSGSRFGIAEDIIGEVLGGGWAIGGTVAGLLVTSQFKGDERFRSMSYSATQGFLINGMFTLSIKLAVGRERPDGSNSRAFPSGHASHSFAFATVLSHYYPRAKVPAYLTAGFVAASRMDENVHFLSDVVAGAALGYIVGRTVVRHTDRKMQEQRVLWAPVVAAEHDGASVGVVIHF